MRFSHAFVVAAAAFLVRAAPTADTEECEADEVVSTRQTSTTEASVVAAVNTTSSSTTTSTASNTTTIFTPVLDPAVNVHDVTNVVPTTNVTLLYASNDTTAADAGLNVTHTMKDGTVLLENIGAITNVTCSSSSVVVSFSNSTVFEAAEAAWSALSNLVLITNHFGECDPTLERGFFSVSSLESDADSLAITCSSSKSDVAGTAAVTEVAFGGLSGTALSKRTTLSSDYTLDFTQALADDTVLYSYSPYVEVTADSASVSAAVTFSGYLKYNWLTFSLNDLYFDIDTDFSADLALSVDVESSYDNTFTYAPSTLEYSLVSVPGILELGPALNFEIGAEISASEAVDVTTEVGMALADGNVHIDLLDESNTSTSGWTPTYTASVNISGQAAAEVNPFVVLTVEIEIKILGGLIDLSTGLTAKPGFNNTIVLTAAEGVDLTGVTGTTSNGSCSEGLALDSEFFFVLDAFATEWYSTELYSVTVPIADECYSWE